MKSNLILIQPTEYNNLFSSYHNDVNTNKTKNNNLPKITKLFTMTNSKQNKVYNNLKLKLKSNKFNNIINDSRHFQYPILNISINNKTMTKASTNLESASYNLDKFYNTNKYNLIKKINNERKNNIQQLKMVYLDLFNFKSKASNDSLLNFDSFFNSIDNFEIMNNEEKEKLSQKLYEINNKSIIKIKNIFNETNFEKLNNDFRLINDIPQTQLNKFSKKLLNIYKDNNNLNIDANSSFNSFNKSQEKHSFKTNNVFFDWILDNVKHKIELKNEYNQHLTSVWVQNLINDEISQLKNKFVDFRKSLNLSNYLERERTNKSFNNRIYIKKDDSYFTSSTYRTNLNQSQRKSSINNNSNIISNYNGSYDHDDLQKSNINKNYTINEMNVGFDFFNIKTNKNRTIKTDGQKNMINFILKKDIKFNSINNQSNNNKIHLKNDLIKKKNKTELNNEYEGKNSELIKKLYVNEPRSSKVKNFKMNIPDDIKSKFPIINNEFNNKRFSSISKNVDIMEKINNKSKDNDSSQDSNDSFYSIKRAKHMHRKSMRNSPSRITILQNLEIQPTNNDSKIDSSKKNSNYKRYSEAWRKPTFKDLKYKNVVTSLFKNGKYIPRYEEDSSDEYSSSDSSDSDSESDESSDDIDEKNKSNKKDNSKKKKKKKKNKKKSKNKSKEKSVKKNKTKYKKKKDDKKKKNTKKNKSKKSKIVKKGSVNLTSLNESLKDESLKEKEKELINKIEKNELIKELNQKLYDKKTKNVKYDSEDINQIKKVFTKKKKKENSKNKKEKRKSITRKSLKPKVSKKEKEEKEGKKIKKEEGKEDKKEEEKKLEETKEENEIISEIEEENNPDEPSIYSISSNSNEDDDMLENLQIKNEVDIMNLLISNNESRNVFNWIYDLKKDLRKKDKNEEDRKIIKENKNQIKGVVDKYFRNLVSKLTINSIKKENVHLNIFNELELIKKYGIYTRKDLNRLVKKSLEERYDNDYENEKYNRFYYYDEYDEYFRNKGEKKKRIMKKAFSQEIKSRKIKFRKITRIGFDDLKTQFGKKKKRGLIYDNSYLFRENHSDDDEQNKFIIRKEIQEILNKEYNEMIKAKKEEIAKERKRKNKEFYLSKKVPFKKKAIKRNILKIVDDSVNEPIQNKRVNTEQNLKEIEREKERDKRLYEFFSKIQKLKKRKSINEEKLNRFIDEQIEERYKIKNHQRLFQFLEEFNLNRTVAKNNSNSINKRIGYISPIIFTSPNEGASISNYMNYK